MQIYYELGAGDLPASSQTRIESSNLAIAHEKNFICIDADRIELQSFELETSWMRNYCEYSLVWRWFIQKISHTEEQLTIYLNN